MLMGEALDENHALRMLSLRGNGLSSKIMEVSRRSSW